MTAIRRARYDGLADWYDAFNRSAAALPFADRVFPTRVRALDFHRR